MTDTIKQIVESAGYLICPTCEGEGEVGYFCGHETTVTCKDCDGHGAVRSLARQTHRRTCHICKGRGGPGCCKNRGYQEWESYELCKSSMITPS